MRNGIVFAGLLIFVIFVNASVISFDLMYAEQPMLFTANQTIQSWSDLLNIYLYPKMLDIFSIPFFRPSGHFLLYQVLMPLLGWHNTKALIVINLIFLALTGYILIRIYALLFPGYQAGGYLAFSIYLMHPALMLSRLIVLHFEFAYVFFTLLSFYCFAHFCRELPSAQGNCEQRKSQPYYLLLGSLLCYFVAITFKESAILLGPVLVCYFCLSRYHGGPWYPFLYRLLSHKQTLQILALLTAVTGSLAFYLTLAWPALTHPLESMITPQEKAAAAVEFVKILLGFSSEHGARAALYQPHLVWREIIFTPAAKAVTWIAFFIVLISCTMVSWERGRGLLREGSPGRSGYGRSLFFLWVAAILFIVLPVNWAMGLPWHVSLTLIFLCLIAGFAAEYLALRWMKNKKRIFALGLMVSTVVGLTAIPVNHANIAHLVSRQGFALTLGHNAILHPPAIQDQLNPNTVLVVADSILHDSYALGNSAYPLFLKTDLNFDELEKTQAFSLLKYQPIYNGYLFKWAYLQPALQEEVYPFDVADMRSVPDAVIHDWLQHYDNIICLGYDKEANWHDRTAEFKRNLLREKTRRLLIVHQYEPYAATFLNGNIIYTKKLILPDHHICQYECDQNVRCKGFTYENARYQYHSIVKCQFYDAVAVENRKFCATCIGFTKS